MGRRAARGTRTTVYVLQKEMRLQNPSQLFPALYTPDLRIQGTSCTLNHARTHMHTKPQPLKTSALKGGARRELVFDATAPTLRFDQLPSVVTWMRQPELLPSPAAMPAGPDDESMALLEMEAESLPEPTSSSLQCLLSGSDDGCVAFSDGKVLIDGVFHKTGAPSSRTC